MGKETESVARILTTYTQDDMLGNHLATDVKLLCLKMLITLFFPQITYQNQRLSPQCKADPNEPTDLVTPMTDMTPQLRPPDMVNPNNNIESYVVSLYIVFGT